MNRVILLVSSLFTSVFLFLFVLGAAMTWNDARADEPLGGGTLVCGPCRCSGEAYCYDPDGYCPSGCVCPQFICSFP